MAEEYYKEIEVSNWRSVMSILLFLLLVFSIFIVPKYTAIETYSYQVIDREPITGYLISTNNTIVNGDVVVDDTEHIAYYPDTTSVGEVAVPVSNFTDYMAVVFNFTLLNDGFGELDIRFNNSTTLTTVLSLKLEFVEITTNNIYVDLVVNDVLNYETRKINRTVFSNFYIILMDTGEGYRLYLNDVYWDINSESISVQNTKAVIDYAIFSGVMLYYQGLHKVSEEKISIHTERVPLLKDMLYFIFFVQLFVVTFLLSYIFRAYYLEIGLISGMIMIVLMNLALNLTYTTAILVGIMIVLLEFSILVRSIEFPIENLDQYLETHLPRVTLIYAVFLIFYFYLAVL